METLVAYHTAGEDPSAWELDKLESLVKTIFPDTVPVADRLKVARQSIEGKEDVLAVRTELITKILDLTKEAYLAVEEAVGDQVLMTDIEKMVMLRSIDDLWIEHLETMDHLRKGVGLQGYGQRDPLVEYKKEAYRLFHEFLAHINERVTRTVFRVQVARQVAQQEHAMMSAVPTQNIQLSGPEKEVSASSVGEEVNPTATRADIKLKDIGRNDVCPCGSGKKFKKCHGA
jgi:preprotein translocase subunit SecA